MARAKANKIPQPLSPGEEEFALHCRVEELAPQREVELIPGRKWRFDFWFPEANLAIEIEGGTKYGKSRHSRGTGFDDDARKYNAAAAAGITLFRFSTSQVFSGEAVATVKSFLESKK